MYNQKTCCMARSMAVVKALQLLELSRIAQTQYFNNFIFFCESVPFLQNLDSFYKTLLLSIIQNVKPSTISLPRERDPTKTLILGIFLDFTRFVAEHCEKIRSPGYQLILLISPNAAIVGGGYKE